MNRPTGETLTLTPEQTKCAERLLKRTINGDIESPTDVVDAWEEPNCSINWDRKEDSFCHGKKFIRPSAIVGSDGMMDRLEKRRMKKVLQCMLAGEFERQHTFPPVLRQFEDRFHVTNDGHHRCMVGKAIGLDGLYVEYEVVPPELIE